MRNLFYFNCMFRQTMIIVLLANTYIASGQTDKKKHFAIPENINKVFQTSCMPCHGSNGGRLPKSRLCFSRWAGYGAAKEVDKASLICSAVRKGKMPPKIVRDSKPELIPTKEQADLICNWAELLKSERREK